ncbi:hypothetical protein D3C81_1771580 [compost metagenome]
MPEVQESLKYTSAGLCLVAILTNKLFIVVRVGRSRRCAITANSPFLTRWAKRVAVRASTNGRCFFSNACRATVTGAASNDRSSLNMQPSPNPVLYWSLVLRPGIGPLTPALFARNCVYRPPATSAPMTAMTMPRPAAR